MEPNGDRKKLSIGILAGGKSSRMGENKALLIYKNQSFIERISEEFVFLCASDMPFMKKELVEYLCQFICGDHDCYIVRDEQRVHPLCGIYSKKMLQQVEEAISSGNYRLMKLLERVRVKYIDMKYTCFESKILRNINHRSDYQECLFPIVFCVSGVKNSGKTDLFGGHFDLYCDRYSETG